MTIQSELRLPTLPVIGDVHEEFERKARELGLEPDTVLSSPYPPPSRSLDA